MADTQYKVTYGGETKIISDPAIISQLEGDPEFSVEPILEAPAKQETMGSVETALRSAADSALFGFSDEIGGLGDKIGGEFDARVLGKEKAKTLAEYVANRRQALASGRAENPVAGTMGGLAGIAAAPMGALKGAQELSLLERAAKLAKLGAIQGGIYGAGTSDIGSKPLNESVADIAIGAGTGALASPLLERAFAGGKKLVGLGEKGLEKIGSYLGITPKKPVGVESTESIIAKEAKAQLPPSREEALQETEKQLSKYNKLAREELNNSLQQNMADDLIGLNRSIDKIKRQANTGLKGEMVSNTLSGVFKQLPFYQKKEIVKNAKSGVKEAIKEISNVASGILEGESTRERSTGGEMKNLKGVLDEYINNWKKLDTNKNDAETLSNLYIFSDKLKRKIDDSRDNIKTDRAAWAELSKTRHQLKEFLENPKIWGKDVTDAQKEINKAWSDWNDYDDVVMGTFMRKESKRVIPGESPYSPLAEGEGTKIGTVLANPDKKAHSADVRNLREWLDRTDNLMNVLVSRYKPTDELKQEVANIGKIRGRIVGYLKAAGEDYAQGKAVAPVGILAKASLDTSRARGVQSDAANEIERLLGQQEYLTTNQMAQDVGYRSNLLNKIDQITKQQYAREHPNLMAANKTAIESMPAIGRFASGEINQTPIGGAMRDWFSDKPEEPENEFIKSLNEIDQSLYEEMPKTNEQIKRESVSDAVYNFQNTKPKAKIIR